MYVCLCVFVVRRLVMLIACPVICFVVPRRRPLPTQRLVLPPTGTGGAVEAEAAGGRQVREVKNERRVDILTILGTDDGIYFAAGVGGRGGGTGVLCPPLVIVSNLVLLLLLA